MTWERTSPRQWRQHRGAWTALVGRGSADAPWNWLVERKVHRAVDGTTVPYALARRGSDPDEAAAKQQAEDALTAVAGDPEADEAKGDSQ